MRHPALETKSNALLFLGQFLLGGVIAPLSLASLSPLSPGQLSLQGLFSACLLCFWVILFWYIVRFSRLSGKSPLNALLNHAALLVLALFVWLGTEYLMLYAVVKPDMFQQLAQLIPLKGVIGTLVFAGTVREIRQKEGLNPYINQQSTDDVEPDFFDEIEPPVLKKPTETQPKIDKITVKSGANIHLIPLTELHYLQAEGDYVILYTATNRYIKEETMKQMESQLPVNFLRVHRSSLVNTDFISRIELYEKQHYRITLKSGQQIRASLTGYKLLKERLHL